MTSVYGLEQEAPDKSGLQITHGAEGLAAHALGFHNGDSLSGLD